MPVVPVAPEVPVVPVVPVAPEVPVVPVEPDTPTDIVVAVAPVAPEAPVVPVAPVTLLPVVPVTDVSSARESTTRAFRPLECTVEYITTPPRLPMPKERLVKVCCGVIKETASAGDSSGYVASGVSVNEAPVAASSCPEAL